MTNAIVLNNGYIEKRMSSNSIIKIKVNDIIVKAAATRNVTDPREFSAEDSFIDTMTPAEVKFANRVYDNTRKTTKLVTIKGELEAVYINAADGLTIAIDLCNNGYNFGIVNVRLSASWLRANAMELVLA